MGAAVEGGEGGKEGQEDLALGGPIARLPIFSLPPLPPSPLPSPPPSSPVSPATACPPTPTHPLHPLPPLLLPSSSSEPRYGWSSNTNLSDGAWHHVALTTWPDGSRGYRLFVDGNLAADMPAGTQVWGRCRMRGVIGWWRYGLHVRIMEEKILGGRSQGVTCCGMLDCGSPCFRSMCPHPSCCPHAADGHSHLDSLKPIPLSLPLLLLLPRGA